MSRQKLYPFLTRELLEVEYVTMRKSSPVIAKELGVSKTTISNALSRLGISKKPRGWFLFVDLTGRVFGRLTVLRQFGRSGNKTLWEAKCECGTVRAYKSDNLTLGHSKSCGCRLLEKGSKSWNWNGHGEISSMFWSRTKRNALQKQRKFEISIEWAWELFLRQGRRCALSGPELQFGRSSHEQNCGMTTASLDRINSEVGYIEDNVQWIHKSINQMKSDLPEAIFVDMCRRVTEYQELEEVISH